MEMKRAFEAMHQQTPEERQALRKATEDQVLRLVLRAPGRVVVESSRLITLAAIGPCR